MPTPQLVSKIIMLNSYVDINQINGPSVKVKSHMCSVKRRPLKVVQTTVLAHTLLIQT